MAEIIHKTAPKATKLLGETADRLDDLISQGHSMKSACEKAGVAYPTFRLWMLRGSDPKADPLHKCPEHIRVEPYYSFARRMRQAELRGKRAELPRRPSGPKPAAITPVQRERIMSALRDGWSLHAAARYAGVRLSTLLSWLHRGGFPRRLTAAIPVSPDAIEEPYYSFAQDVLRAEAAYFTDESVQT
jgi:lambda repressor-like predicted transcriptional regulator